MKLSSMIKNLRESATLKMLERAKRLEREGVEVVYLNIGEPDFDTPQHIKEAAYEAMKSGYTHYTTSRGLPELREAIAEKLRTENNLDVNADNILVTPGAKQAILEAILALVDRGDEVLMPVPAWVSFEEMVTMAGGVVKRVKTTDEYKIDPEALNESVGDKTKLIILNSPNNPTGAVYSRSDLEKVAEIAMDNEIYVISDEIYEKIIYEGEHFSIGSIPGMEELTITINGFSKSYAMTGWRLGYAAGPEDVISAMNKIQQNSVTCAAAFVQKAGVVALKSPQDFTEEMVNEFRRRRRFLVDELSKIEVVDVRMPEGAFYVFPDISKTGMNSMEFTDFLLEKAGVVVAPGRAFGGYDANIRISYATSLENLEKAVERMKEALSS